MPSRNKPVTKTSARGAAKRERATHPRAPASDASRARQRHARDLEKTTRQLLRNAGIARAKIEVRGKEVVIAIATAVIDRLAGPPGAA